MVKLHHQFCPWSLSGPSGKVQKARRNVTKAVTSLQYMTAL